MSTTDDEHEPRHLSRSQPHVRARCETPLREPLEVDLRPGLGAGLIDGHLKRAASGRDFSCRVLASHFGELHESGKYEDLGYTCFAQYADQRLSFEPRRARELCLAGRALVTPSRIDRTQRASCSEFERMLKRHREGLSVERSEDDIRDGAWRLMRSARR